MPITAFLEDLLKAPAIHLPLGQSSDNAHLPNERCEEKRGLYVCM